MEIFIFDFHMAQIDIKINEFFSISCIISLWMVLGPYLLLLLGQCLFILIGSSGSVGLLAGCLLVECLLVSLMALLVLKARTVVRDNLMFLVFILIYSAGSNGCLISIIRFFGETTQLALTCPLKFSVVCSLFTTSFRWPGALICGLSCCTDVFSRDWFYKPVYV